MRGDVPDICFRNTDGEEIFSGLEVDVDWMRNPRLSVDYTCNIKLSFTLTICDRLQKITPQGLRQVHVNAFLACFTIFKSIRK